jgi:hypothetical protein
MKVVESIGILAHDASFGGPQLRQLADLVQLLDDDFRIHEPGHRYLALLYIYATLVHDPITFYLRKKESFLEKRIK